MGEPITTTTRRRTLQKWIKEQNCIIAIFEPLIGKNQLISMLISNQ